MQVLYSRELKSSSRSVLGLLFSFREYCQTKNYFIALVIGDARRLVTLIFSFTCSYLFTDALVISYCLSNIERFYHINFRTIPITTLTTWLFPRDFYISKLAFPEKQKVLLEVEIVIYFSSVYCARYIESCGTEFVCNRWPKWGVEKGDAVTKLIFVRRVKCRIVGKPP